MYHLVRITLASITATLFTIPTATFAQDYDVRKAYWGMSPWEVQMSEKRPPDFKGPSGNYYYTEYDQIYYKNGRRYSSGSWVYLFQRNKLAKVNFKATWNKTELSLYDKDKAHYTKKYGKPSKTENTDKKRVDEWWVNDRTFLRLYLNKVPRVTSGYASYYYWASFFEAEHKKELDKKKRGEK